MAGMMISMTNSMMASVSIGTIIGTYIQSKDLTIPIIASVSIGMIIGYLTGKPVSLMASIDGLTAGVMGGMMGSMLGVMLQPKSVDLMIYFIDVIFVLIMLLLLRLIEEESRQDKQGNPLFRKPLIANPIFLIAAVVLLGTLVFGKGLLFPSKTVAIGGNNQVEPTAVSSNIQEITITPNSYTPNNIVLKSGKPSIINFIPQEGSACLQTIRSEQLGLNLKLEEGKDNFVSLEGLESGIYEYACGMNMYKGTITVQ